MKKRLNQTIKLGQIVATPGVLEMVSVMDINEALCRHKRCDYGDCCDEDWEENNYSVINGLRVLSVYRSSNGVKFWIITEAGNSSTCVLLPSEY